MQAPCAKSLDNNPFILKLRQMAKRIWLEPGSKLYQKHLIADSIQQFKFSLVFRYILIADFKTFGGNRSNYRIIDTLECIKVEVLVFTALVPEDYFRLKAMKTPARLEDAILKAKRKLSIPSVKGSISGSWEPVKTTGIGMFEA